MSPISRPQDRIEAGMALLVVPELLLFLFLPLRFAVIGLAILVFLVGYGSWQWQYRAIQQYGGHIKRLEAAKAALQRLVDGEKQELAEATKKLDQYEAT